MLTVITDTSKVEQQAEPCFQIGCFCLQMLSLKHNLVCSILLCHFRCTAPLPPECSKDEGAKYQETCSILTDENSVFKNCIVAVGEEVIYNSSIYQKLIQDLLWLQKSQQFEVLTGIL